MFSSANKRFCTKKIDYGRLPFAFLYLTIKTIQKTNKMRMQMVRMTVAKLLPEAGFVLFPLSGTNGSSIGRD